ncbi:uncharacterized protein LOC115092844 isoform X3 [Rhinatrema bivittatum]|nr:uncharacterized protein LOC115092844 isoform X3 [Rhinatrema bivittatum]
MIPPNLTDLLSKAAGTPVPPHGWIWVLSNATPRAVVSTAEPAQKSGIVPGIIAAAIFISFLLCLYAILWKCMVYAPKRNMKRHKAKPLPDRLLPDKTIC